VRSRVALTESGRLLADAIGEALMGAEKDNH